MGISRHLQICAYAEVDNIQVEKEVKGCEKQDCPFLGEYNVAFCGKCGTSKEIATKITTSLSDKVPYQALYDAVGEDILCYFDHKDKIIFTGNRRGESIISMWCDDDLVQDFSSLNPAEEIKKFEERYSKELNNLKELYGSIALKFGLVFNLG